MKHFISFFAAAFISVAAFAQLPDGSIAPDFTAIDINGNEHNLYALLDSGYQVILHFDVTWNSPGFFYHEEGTLETLNETYGPDGTNELRVFLLESDDYTNLDDLNGTGNNTQGDWVTGTTYPIIDDAGDIFFNSYLGAYYPTIYTICPNRILTQSGQIGVAAHANIFQDANCEPASDVNDPSLINYTGDVLSCGDDPVMLSVSLMNQGLEPLTACTITAYDGAMAVGSMNWTGYLETYDFEDILVTTTTVTTDTNFSIEVISDDQNSTNNSVAAAVIVAQESTNNVRLTLLTDAYPSETFWMLFDETFNVVAQGGPYSEPGEEIIVDWQLDLGCYTFVIQDAFGDGFHASWFNGVGPDGGFSLNAMDGFSVTSTLLSSYAPDEFLELEVSFEVTSFSTPPGAGCTDPLAYNYVPEATIDDGSCQYFATNCNFLGDASWGELGPGLYLGQPQVEHELGAYVSGEFVIHVPAFFDDPNGGSYELMSWENLTWSGLPEGISVGNEPTNAEANAQSCLTYSGAPYQEGVFQVTVTGDLMVSVFGNPVSAGVVTSSFTMVILPSGNGVLGCTYANASNYLPVANIDDGSCVYEGCMNPEACNFQIFATVDDGSCTFDCATNDGPCMFDSNGDGSVGSGDLLQFLTAFGETCE